MEITQVRKKQSEGLPQTTTGPNSEQMLKDSSRLAIRVKWPSSPGRWILALVTFQSQTRDFKHFHVDIVGPLPESHGHKYLLTIYDRCSRWVEAFALRRDTADEVSKAFLQYVSRFGLPSSVCSDNGNSFIANLWQDIMKQFGIEVKFTPAYHAATNGPLNASIKTSKTPSRQPS